MSTPSGREPKERNPKLEPLAESLERLWKNITSRGKEPSFQCGLRVLDQGTWGIEPSQLMTIAARPGVGKTAFACQIAMQYAKQGHKVAFLSLEMTRETILERMFCIEQDLDAWALRSGLIDENTEKAYSRFCANIGNLPLRIIDDYCHTQDELYRLIEHLNFRPNLIILDHIQHIRAIERKSNWETLTEYLRYLKELAMKHEIAVIALSQINRQGDEHPTLANLKGTGAIEEMSDFVLLLHQLKEFDDNGKNFQIQVAKNRFGPVGTFRLFFKFEHTKFHNEKPYTLEVPDEIH